MLILHDIPGTHREERNVKVGGSQATAYQAGWIAPFKCTVTAFKVLPLVAITGDNTNTIHFNVDGPDVATEIANLDYATGTNGALWTEQSMTYATNVDFEAGEAAMLEAEEIGTGQAAEVRVSWIIEYKAR